ncbi:hypothetical protein ACPCAB_13700 [Streptomyces koyangensis]|uniref:hypothetical protein n=1 Tax=Streptomyces TaxID=1883 RepID=UPI00101EB277|nr:hypothetical protein [Streptomyces sp. SCA2-2]RZE95577.1 hypothetical protein C0L86_18980 [Streptomyces sp. SCA2-2]
MRTATIAGRPALLVDGLAVDIEQASDALFPPLGPPSPVLAVARIPHPVREAYARLAAGGATAGAA